MYEKRINTRKRTWHHPLPESSDQYDVHPIKE